MYLLDTNALLFFLSDDARLSRSALAAIQSDSPVLISVVSLWEIAIKKNIGKLDISYSITEIVKACAQQNFTLLPINPEHLDALSTLPSIHNDPFDRLLIAQAQTEHLVLITKDTIIPKYDVQTIW
jgi:PIN domain nuclease of toxin-antitoxin system